MTVLVCDGRRPVGTVTLDDATGMWKARCTILHAGFHFLPGQHLTKAEAAEAVLRIHCEFSVWDM